MPSQSRHARRALAAGTALGVAAALGLGLAPSASAYYGSSGTVKNAVLTTAQIGAAIGWNTATDPLTGSYVNSNAYDWENDTQPATVTDAQVVPSEARLTVGNTTASRNTYFGNAGAFYAGKSTNPPVQTSTRVTADIFEPAVGTDPAQWFTITLLKSGSDGVVFGACSATSTTTTTSAQRTTCSLAIATAQAASWAKVSPTVVFRSTSAVKAKLLTAKQARHAVKVPSGTTTRIVATRTSSATQGGREITRTYLTTSAKIKKIRLSAPYVSAVIQFGNRLDATVAFASYEKGDRSRHKLHGVTSTRYTMLVPAKAGGKKTTIAITATRYADVVAVASCEANPYKKPTTAALISCSQKLGAAQVTRASSLFKHIH